MPDGASPRNDPRRIRIASLAMDANPVVASCSVRFTGFAWRAVDSTPRLPDQKSVRRSAHIRSSSLNLREGSDGALQGRILRSCPRGI